uniref:Uncharacterized protein n=1 Tax=Nelumbo nucifera TaxID=4432 RepID=A0A823A5P9_NELNU|nr:TPA_asm: hypothetical protein HUJ06_019055 [Nelumbo nucifera]
MSTASTLYNDNLASAVNQLLNFPETIVEKFVYPSFARSSKPTATEGSAPSIPVHVLESRNPQGVCLLHGHSWLLQARYPGHSGERPRDGDTKQQQARGRGKRTEMREGANTYD